MGNRACTDEVFMRMQVKAVAEGTIADLRSRLKERDATIRYEAHSSIGQHCYGLHGGQIISAQDA